MSEEEKWPGMTSTKMKISTNSLSGFELLSDAYQMELATKMNAFKSFCAECSRANVSIKPLINLLSIIYGQSQVVKGLLAMFNDKISSAPIMLNREILSEYCTLLRLENEIVEWILDNAQSGLETKSTEQQ